MEGLFLLMILELLLLVFNLKIILKPSIPSLPLLSLFPLLYFQKAATVLFNFMEILLSLFLTLSFPTIISMPVEQLSFLLKVPLPVLQIVLLLETVQKKEEVLFMLMEILLSLFLLLVLKIILEGIKLEL